MSLDSYILKKYYIGANFEHRKITGTIDIFERGKKLDINFNEVRYIECQAAHLESAYMIHDWFVKNVQGGEDDCNQYHVERAKLKELFDTCNKVLENRELADELLPTGEEYYFKSEVYTEEYYDCLENVVGVLSKINFESEDYSFDFYYESAW